MFILTGIHGDGRLARIWDSEDGITEDIDFVTISKNVTEKGIKVQGLRPYKANEVYPPDKVVVPELSIVVVPSEASAALRAVKMNAAGGEN